MRCMVDLTLSDSKFQGCAYLKRYNHQRRKSSHIEGHSCVTYVKLGYKMSAWIKTEILGHHPPRCGALIFGRCFFKRLITF